jgi:hypothetical protein
MDLKDITKNQHFVSQVEQKLNAINPLAEEENRRIFSFSLVDRESSSISLDSQMGCKISRNLSLNDIFSFDVLKGDATRYNFEKLFHKYEATIKTNTESLISKLTISNADIKSEIINIFLSKFLNFVRNPYSIHKVLNTFPQLKNIYPTDPLHYKNFERVLNGTKPQQRHICNELGVTEDEYKNWLSSIFLLLTPIEKNKPNYLDQAVNGLFENKNRLIMVCIYTYDNKTCLLSDRGYTSVSEENDFFVLDFNLYSNGFIRYSFSEVSSFVHEGIPKNFIEIYKNGPQDIVIHKIKNDLDTLAQYNNNTVYQCSKNIFNSSSECHGVNVKM